LLISSRGCIEQHLNDISICPECKQPAWHKDLNKSHEVSERFHSHRLKVEMICQSLRELEMFLENPSHYSMPVVFDSKIEVASSDGKRLVHSKKSYGEFILGPIER
jgi:hypothetical protein